MVAAVLNGEEAARALGGGDGAEPRARVRLEILVVVRDHPRDARHRGEVCRVKRRRAARDDDARRGPLAVKPPHRLAGAAQRLGGDGAGVDDGEVRFAESLRLTRELFRFDHVEPAAERHGLDVLLRRKGRERAHAASPSKVSGASRVSNSSATGPVIWT